MQFHLSFDTEQLVLPLSHQHALQSSIYALLAKSTQGREVHAVVPELGERAFRGFVFGALQGERRVTFVENTPILHFTGKTYLEVRTPLPQLADVFANVMQVGTQMRLLKNEPFPISDVTVTDKAPCVASPWTIRMCTPMIARRTIGDETIFYEPSEPEFAELMRRNFERKYRSLTGKKPNNFSLTPLTVSNHDKVSLDMKGTPLLGWGGTYILEGEIGELNFLYNAGLGSKNSAGFGMFNPTE